MSAEYEVFDIESEKRQVGMGSNKRVRDASQALDGNSFVTVKTNIENLKDAIEFFHEVQVLKSIHPQLSTSWPVFLAKDGSKPQARNAL